MDAKLQTLVLALSVSAITACGGSSSSSDSPSNPVDAKTETTGLESFNETLSAANITVSETKSGGADFQNIPSCENRNYVVAGQYDTRVAFNEDAAGSTEELKHYARIAALALNNHIDDLSLGDRGYVDAISKSPWKVCISTNYDGGQYKGSQDGQINETIVSVENDDISLYKLINHEMIHGVTRAITGVNASQDASFPEFIEEGVAVYVANQELISFGDTWRQWFENDVNPLTVINYADRGVESDNPSYYDIYPYYHATARYFLADDGLGLSETELLDLIEDGVTKDDFSQAFNDRNLGTTFTNLQSNAKTTIGSWLDSRTKSRFDLTNWNGAEITAVGLPGRSGLATLDPNVKKVNTGTFEASLSFYEDQKMTLIFKSDGTVYEAGSTTLENGQLTQDEYDVSGADPYQP
jgi:hypothetical protein